MDYNQNIQIHNKQFKFKRFKKYTIGKLYSFLPYHCVNISIIKNKRLMETFLEVEFFTMKVKTRLISHQQMITSIIKIDENHIATGSWDMNIKIWNVSKRFCLGTLRGHSNVVLCLVKIDKELIASGSGDLFSINSSSGDFSIKIWNIGFEACLNTLNGHNDQVISLFKLDVGIIVSGSYDTSIKIWDIEQGICLKTFYWQLEYYIKCLIKLDTNTIIGGSDNETIKIWNLPEGECKQKLIGHSQPIKCLTKLSNNK